MLMTHSMFPSSPQDSPCLPRVVVYVTFLAVLKPLIIIHIIKCCCLLLCWHSQQLSCSARALWRQCFWNERHQSPETQRKTKYEINLIIPTVPRLREGRMLKLVKNWNCDGFIVTGLVSSWAGQSSDIVVLCFHVFKILCDVPRVKNIEQSTFLHRPTTI